MTIRVAVIDDQPLIRAGISALLALHSDISVVGEAADGSQAVALVARLDPDVVLLDIVMPQLDGISAARRLREAGSRTRMLMLTTLHEDAQARAALAAGARGYLLKDVDHRVLADAVRAVAAGGVYLHAGVADALLPAAATAAADTAVPAVAAVARADLRGSLLNPRERALLRLLAAGASNAEIADQLHVSVGTVKNQLSTVFSKLDVRDRTQAALWARSHPDALRD
jgi:DNA-binding NarL/FixJ family response regulator